MARNKFADVIRYFRGYIIGKPKLDASSDYATLGSINVLFLGQARPRPFKGLEQVSDEAGTDVTLQVGDGIAGLGPKA